MPAVAPHHILPKSQGGTDDLDNLIPLCAKMHREAHAKGAAHFANYFRNLKRRAEVFLAR